jgi:hypothetical protein
MLKIIDEANALFKSNATTPDNFISVMEITNLTEVIDCYILHQILLTNLF